VPFPEALETRSHWRTHRRLDGGEQDAGDGEEMGCRRPSGGSVVDDRQDHGQSVFQSRPDDWQRSYLCSPESSGAEIVREDPLSPVNLAFDAAGDLLVVSYEGDGTVYSFRPDSSEQQITYLRRVPGEPKQDSTSILPVNVWSRRELLRPLPWRYISPGHNVYIPVTDGFVQGELYYGTKMASILHAPGLAPELPGHSFCITDQSENQTLAVRVTDAGSIESTKLFLQESGDAVTQDRKGNAYLAAEPVPVYSPADKLVRRIDVPERPVNLVFGGKDRRTLYILSHQSLYAVEMKDAGL
jgi:SMP-30/Gluconolactonase/LRE-like region